MIVCFTGDWHIKLGQKNVPIKWQVDRFNMLVDKINKLEFDVLVIAGDIFDKVPSLDELELYFNLVAKFKTKTVIFDGNHEAGKRGTTWLSKLKETTKIINNLVDIIDNNTDILPNIDIIPYTKLKTFNNRNYHNKVLMTHVRGSIPPYVIPEIDLEVFSKWDLILSCDLHDHSATQEPENAKYNIVYPGSPLSCSFHRKPISNGIILYDTNSIEWEFIPLGLPQLLRRTIDSADLAVPTAYDHTIYEINGNIEELSNVETTDLIDRKVVNSNKESELILDGMTIQEELDIYLSKILNIKNTKDIIRTFNDHT